MNESTSLTNELTGGVQTDHGGMGIGDIIVILLDLVLLIYTGFRSYDFLSSTVPSDWQILALVGLWGLDIGAIAWSLVWIFGSTEKYQDWVSMTFFVIDLVGVVLTSLTDSLMYGAEGKAMTETLTGVAVVVVPLVVVLNVVAGFIYHMTSPATKEQRARRRAEAEHRRKMRELYRMEQDLQYAEEYLLKRQDTLDKSTLLAQMKIQQDAIERATRAALRDQTGGAEGVNDKLAALKARLDALKAQAGGPTGQSEPAPAGEDDEFPYRLPAAQFARDPNGPKSTGWFAHRRPQQQSDSDDEGAGKAPAASISFPDVDPRYPLKPHNGNWDEYGRPFWMAHSGLRSTGDVMDAGECSLPENAWYLGEKKITEETHNFIGAFQKRYGHLPYCWMYGTNPRAHKADVCETCPLHAPKAEGRSIGLKNLPTYHPVPAPNGHQPAEDDADPSQAG